LLQLVNQAEIAQLKMQYPSSPTSTSPPVLLAGERREIRFRVFGIDPTATADDASGAITGSGSNKDAAAEKSSIHGDSRAQHDTIPYTGVGLAVLHSKQTHTSIRVEIC
jgi:hypothetical protein